MPSERLAYLDASAFVKLVVAEPETRALRAALSGVGRIVASEILEIEVLRATRRGGGDTAHAHRQLGRVRLLPLTATIRARASDLRPPTVRSLDAIHIATALQLQPRLEAFYAYDERMLAAAHGAGLQVAAPDA